MASIIREMRLNTGADRAWATLRDVGAAHRAFPGVLVDCRQDGDVDTDETRRRFAYAVVEGRFDHHSASMQVLVDGDYRCHFVWVGDFLPNELEPMVRPLVDQGCEAFRRAAEGA